MLLHRSVYRCLLRACQRVGVAPQRDRLLSRSSFVELLRQSMPTTHSIFAPDFRPSSPGPVSTDWLQGLVRHHFLAAPTAPPSSAALAFRLSCAVSAIRALHVVADRLGSDADGLLLPFTKPAHPRPTVHQGTDAAFVLPPPPHPTHQTVSTMRGLFPTHPITESVLLYILGIWSGVVFALILLRKADATTRRDASSIIPASSDEIDL